MTPAQRQLYAKAQAERDTVCNWLLALMAQSPQKPMTKDSLQNIAMQKLGVSKSSFNAGWDLAIIKSGNEHWWAPLPRRKSGATPRH